MRENAGKIRTRVTPNTGTFYAVEAFLKPCQTCVIGVFLARIVNGF